MTNKTKTVEERIADIQEFIQNKIGDKITIDYPTELVLTKVKHVLLQNNSQFLPFNKSKPELQLAVARSLGYEEDIISELKQLLNLKEKELAAAQEIIVEMKRENNMLKNTQDIELITAKRELDEMKRESEALKLYKKMSNNYEELKQEIKDSVGLLEEENKRLKKENEWRPISEAPKNKFILIYDEENGVYAGMWAEEIYECWKGHLKPKTFINAFADPEDGEHNPTHFMNLPQPPKLNK